MTVATAAEIDLSRLRLREVDELLRRLDAQRRRNHENQTGLADQRDRLEVLLRIVGQLGVDERVDDHHRIRRNQHRVAVTRSLRDAVGGQVAARAGTVVDNDRLTGRGAQLVGHESGKHVAERAWGAADDDLARLAWELVRPSRESRQQQRGSRDQHRESFASSDDRRLSESGEAIKNLSGSRWWRNA